MEGAFPSVRPAAALAKPADPSGPFRLCPVLTSLISGANVPPRRGDGRLERRNRDKWSLVMFYSFDSRRALPAVEQLIIEPRRR